MRQLFAILAIIALGGVAQPATAEQTKLKADERIKTGTFDNGLKWMFRAHDNPPGKMALLLHIDTGSINETDDQRGLAHFIEHMCFNGTENYPPGTLIPYFESIGMEFGADLNASTGFDTTSYMLFLPNTDSDEIDKALGVLSDFAFRTLFDAEEIDKERGIILSEKRARDNVAFRMQIEEWKKIYGDARFANRLPIGTEEVINNAGRDRFVAYYDKWYRPDMMTMIVVGDTTLDKVKPLIEKNFGSEKNDGPKPTPMAAEIPESKPGQALVMTDPEYKYCQASLLKHLGTRPPATTEEAFRTELLERLAQIMLARRYEDRIQRGEASYQTAAAVVSSFLDNALMANGTIACEPAKWEASLSELIEEIVRVRDHGFLSRELELAKKQVVSRAERRVKTEPTTNANGLLMRMSRSVTNEEPIVAAADRLALIERLLPTISVEEISQHFAKQFAPGDYIVTLDIDPTADNVPSNEQLMAAMKAAFARKTEPLPESVEQKALAASDLTPGKIVSEETNEKLGITQAWLSNGIRVNHRFMDYKKDAVNVSINLAGGKIEEAGDSLGRSDAAGNVMSTPATSVFSSSEIRDLMTGKNMRVTGAAAGDKFTLRLIGSPEDLEAGLQVARALLVDGKLEETAFENWKQMWMQQLQLIKSFPEFEAARALSRVISGNDPRAEIGDPERVERQTVADAQAWFTRIARTAPIEVTVVGEISKEDAFALVQKYLGSLPERPRTLANMDALRKYNRGDGPLHERAPVETATKKASAMVGFFTAPEKADDEHLALTLAAQVLSTRLIDDLREEKAWVYSIKANASRNFEYEDSSLLMAGSSCAPDRAEEVVAEINKVFADFAASGPTDEELANAKKQLLNNLDTQMKEPGFWWRILEDSTRYCTNLARYEDPESLVNAVTKDQVQTVMQKYYQPARMFDVVASPPVEASESATPLETAESASQ